MLVQITDDRNQLEVIVSYSFWYLASCAVSWGLSSNRSLCDKPEVSLRAWLAVQMILLAWCDHLKEYFSSKLVQFKRFWLPMKSSLPPAENVKLNENPLTPRSVCIGKYAISSQRNHSANHICESLCNNHLILFSLGQDNWTCRTTSFLNWDQACQLGGRYVSNVGPPSPSQL